MAKQGFQTYNSFKREIKEIKQLYDLTAHLFMQEHNRIKVLLPISNPAMSISTNIGIVNHSLNSLFEATDKKYPDKLRQLILISSITTLEVFLTDLIDEIFLRDFSPFEEQISIEFIKGQILNAPSLKDIQREIISRDMRRLTSGGLTEIRKYYFSCAVQVREVGIGNETPLSNQTGKQTCTVRQVSRRKRVLHSIQ